MSCMQVCYLKYKMKCCTTRKTTEKSPSRKRKSAATGLTHTLVEPSLPAPFPLPLPQAIHASPFIQYGGMIVGEIPHSQPLPQKKSICTLCKRFNGMNAHLCPGKSRHTLCKYFTKEGAPKYAMAMPPVHHRQRARKRCRNCMRDDCRGSGGRIYCTNTK